MGNACTVGPACGNLSVTCKLDPTAAISAAGASLASLTVILGGSGCLQMPYAGRNASFLVDGLVMNQFYRMLVVTEDSLYPDPNRQACSHPLVQALLADAMQSTNRSLNANGVDVASLRAQAVSVLIVLVQGSSIECSTCLQYYQMELGLHISPGAWCLHRHQHRVCYMLADHCGLGLHISPGPLCLHRYSMLRHVYLGMSVMIPSTAYPAAEPCLVPGSTAARPTESAAAARD